MKGPEHLLNPGMLETLGEREGKRLRPQSQAAFQNQVCTLRMCLCSLTRPRGPWAAVQHIRWHRL